MSRLGPIGKQNCPFCGWQGISNNPIGEREDGSIEGWYCPECMGVISYNPAPLYPDKPKRKHDDAPNVLVTATVLSAITLLVLIVVAALLLSVPAPEMDCSTTTLRDDCPLELQPLQLNDRLRDANAPRLDCLNASMQGEC